MQLRVLHPAQFGEVEGLFKQAFTGPLPDSGFIVIAEANGEIIGFSVLQQVWHAEPTYVKPEWRARGVFTNLVSKVAEILPQDTQGVLVTTMNSTLGRVLNYLGFEHVKDLQTFRWTRKPHV